MPDEMNVVDEVNYCNKENNVERTPFVNNEEVFVDNLVAKQVSPVKQAQVTEQNEESSQNDEEVVEKPVEPELDMEVPKNMMEANESDQVVIPADLPQQIPALDDQPADTEAISMLLQPVQPNQLNPVDLLEPVQPSPSDSVQPAVTGPSTRRKRSVRPLNAPKKDDEVVVSSSSAVSLPAVVEEQVPCSQSATLMLKILEKRQSLKTPEESEYLVQWNDLSTTWELYETISCGDMLANFEEELSNRPSRVSSSSKSSARKRQRGKSLNASAEPKKSLNASAKSRKSSSAMMENKRTSVELKPRSTRTSAAKAKLFIEEVTMANESSCDSPRPIKRRKVDDDEGEEEYEQAIDDHEDDVDYGKRLFANLLPAAAEQFQLGPIRQFLIKWQGYDDPVENTWEPAANFLHFNLLVDNFEQNRRWKSLKAAGPCHSVSSSTTSSSVNTKQAGSSRKKSVIASARKRLSSTPKKSTRSTAIKFSAPTSIQKTADANLEQEEDEEEEEEEKIEAIVIQPPKVPMSKEPIWRTFKNTTSDSTTVKGKNPLLFSNSLEYGMQKGLKLSCILKVTKGPSEVGPKCLVRYADSVIQEWVPTSVVFKHFPQDLERKNNISNTTKSLDEEEENS
uniref:Chromo domain-containing protein n=1 Tax=Ditylenchus dipsaci TaxID=166011 RepID=A0A915DS19_9BILA